MGSVIYIPRKESGIYYPNFGLLYNYPAAKDLREITSNSNWVLPSVTQARVLSNYLGISGNYTNSNEAGNPMKEIGTTYWGTAGGTNTAKFNGRGAGTRAGSSAGSAILLQSQYWLSDNVGTLGARMILQSLYNGLETNAGYLAGTTGQPLRIVRTSTTLSHGETGTYTGNDGKVYRTICIGTQEWLADNLCETRFRNNDIIPWYGADPVDYFTNTEWAALTTAGVCAYGNTLSNVAAGFTFPT